MQHWTSMTDLSIASGQVTERFGRGTNGSGYLQYKKVPGLILKVKEKESPSSRLKKTIEAANYIRTSHKTPLENVVNFSESTLGNSKPLQNDQILKKLMIEKEENRRLQSKVENLEHQLINEKSRMVEEDAMIRRLKKKWYRLCHSDIDHPKLKTILDNCRMKYEYLKMVDLLEADVRLFTDRLMTFFLDFIDDVADDRSFEKKKTEYLPEKSARTSRNLESHLISKPLYLSEFLPKQSNHLTSPKFKTQKVSAFPLSSPLVEKLNQVRVSNFQVGSEPNTLHLKDLEFRRQLQSVDDESELRYHRTDDPLIHDVSNQNNQNSGESKPTEKTEKPPLEDHSYSIFNSQSGGLKKQQSKPPKTGGDWLVTFGKLNTNNEFDFKEKLGTSADFHNHPMLGHNEDRKKSVPTVTYDQAGVSALGSNEELKDFLVAFKSETSAILQKSRKPLTARPGY